MKYRLGQLFFFMILPLTAISQNGIFTAQEIDSILLNSQGSCAFFTIVSNVDPPSCNDFSDGTVSVEEPVDGIGPYTYQWFGGPASMIWTGLGAGTYTIIITDQGQNESCSQAVILNEPEDLTVSSMGAIPPSCFGTCDASADPFVIGGNGGNMFDWSSGETTPEATMLCDPFMLTITDSKGCTFDTTFTFTDAPEDFSIDEVITDVDCNGNNNGSIEITINGGTDPYQTDWTGPGTFMSDDEDIFNLELGNYTVNIIDANLCTFSQTFEITEPEPLVVDFTKMDNECFGDEFGEIQLDIMGGVEDYIFDWSGPNGFSSTDEDLMNLGCGTYDLTVTDANFCVEMLSVDILCPDSIQIDELLTDISCFGADDGSIDITVTGGILDYEYLWSGPGTFVSTDEDITGLEPGDYTVIVTDDNDCIVEETFTITEPEDLVLDAMTMTTSCIGDMDGSIDLTITGGTFPFDIVWTGPGAFTSMDEDISNLDQGTYMVTVTDDNDCMETLTVTVDEPVPFNISEIITEASCGGQSNGSIEITFSGGTEPYDFSWTGPGAFTSMDEDIFGLLIGTYDLTVTDANDCVFMISYEVEEVEGFTLDFDVINIDCFGQNAGAIDMTIIGGVAPFNIDWTGPNAFVSQDEDINTLEAGIYNVNVVDQDLCVQNVDVEVLQNDSIEFMFDVIEPSCQGDANGVIDVTVTGGVLDYDYLWTGPGAFMETTEDISMLQGGTYFLTLTDALGCVQIQSVELTDPMPIIVEGVVSDLDCNSDNTGAIDLTITGAVAPYDVMWTGPGAFNSTDEDISGLEAGIYIVNILDFNGCTQTGFFEVGQPDVIEVNADIMDITCFGPNSGSISLDIIGGTEPFTISWTGPGTFSSADEDIFMLAAGTYNLTITDDNNCEFTSSYEIEELEDLTFISNVNDVACNGEDNGSIEIDIMGGTMPYTINWTGLNMFASSDEDIFNLEPGTYNVTIEDDIGCVETGTFEINESDLLELDFTIVNPTCPFDDGSIEVMPSGGIDPYTITWSEFDGAFISNNALIDNLAPGIYMVQVEDLNSCVNGDTITINHPTPIVIETITPVTCPGGTDGAIELEIMTDDPPVDIDWDGPNGFDSSDEDIFGLEAGIYTVEIIDQALCNINLLLEVPVNDPIEILADISPIACQGDNDGAIDIILNNVVDPFTVSWTGPNAFVSSDQDISDLEPGLYTISIIDGNTCQADSTFEILEGVGLDLTFVSEDALCKNSTDGSIDMTINNGQFPFTISWMGPNAFSSANEDIDNLEAGVYMVSIADDNMCQADSMIEIFEPDSILLQLDITQSLCSNSNEGSIEWVSLGGTPAYVFTWTGPNAFSSNDQNIFDLFPGDYVLQVVDNNLCVEDTVISITSPETIAVDFNVTNSTCGNSDGSILATASGGTILLDYSYEWFDASMISIGNNNFINSLSAGVYTLIVTDDNSCMDTSMVTISDDIYTVDAQISNANCGGANDGSIQLTISGAQDPITILWSGPNGFASNMEDIFDLEPGDYEVSITDANNCIFTEIYQVSEPEDIFVDEIIDSPDCFGVNDGSILIDISGGDGDYQIQWTGPNMFSSQDEDIFNLEGGLYTLVVSDMSGCTLTQEFELNIPTEIIATPIFQGPVCPGIPDGFIDITVSGGQAGYTFLWTGPNMFTSMDEDIDFLVAGEYTVVITDSFLCQNEFTYTLANATSIQLDATLTNISCFGDDNGSIVLNPSGGIDPYDFSWTGPNMFTSMDQDIFDLEPGIYAVTANDQLNCETTIEFEIIEPDTLDVEVDISNPTCSFLNDGALDITVSGGNTPYTFSWTGPNMFTSAEEDISGLEDGIYTLQIVDSAMCTFTDSYVLVSPTEITVELDDIISPQCDDSPDGQIFITAMGGVGTLDYSWTGPNAYTSTEEDPTMLTAGIFNLQITDDFSCVLDTFFIVVSQNLLVADAGNYGELCDMDTLVLDASNSIGATSFEWFVDGDAFSTEQSVELALSLNVNEIVLNVSNGICADSDTINLSINELPFVDAGPDIEGLIDETFILGSNPTTDIDNTVIWSPDISLDDPTSFNPMGIIIEDQWYIVTATNAIGCQAIDSVFVDLTSPVNITNTITPNGDGFNEVWILDGSTNFPDIEVEIYNRWGELLFQSSGYSDPWDGTYEGKPLPTGTYYYVILLNDPMFPEHFDGPITIMR